MKAIILSWLSAICTGSTFGAGTQSPRIAHSPEEKRQHTRVSRVFLKCVANLARAKARCWAIFWPENRPISSLSAFRSSRQQLRRPSTLKCFGKIIWGWPEGFFAFPDPERGRQTRNQKPETRSRNQKAGTRNQEAGTGSRNAKKKTSAAGEVFSCFS